MKSQRSGHGTDWPHIAVGAIGVMLAYFVITNHVDLYPWNNLRESQLASTLSGVIPFSIIALVFWLRLRPLMFVGMVYSYVWLGLQIRQWWIPYLFGPTALHESFAWYEEGGYDETVSLLPHIDSRPVPDAQHLVLETLSLLVVITTTLAVITWSRRGATHATNTR